MVAEVPVDMPINEWTFTADVKSWIDQIIRERTDLDLNCDGWEREIDERVAPLYGL